MLQSWIRALMMALVLVLIVPIPSAHAELGNYVVDNTGDASSSSGGNTCLNATANDCSLRRAVELANGTVGSTISFNIPGGPTWTINLLSPLPNIIAANTKILGTLVGGKPVVALNGSTINYTLPGVDEPITQGQGFTVRSAGNTISGLAIYGFDGTGTAGTYGAGIVLEGTGATNNILENNFVGTNLEGTARATANTNNRTGGILVRDGASSNTIRGNLISGNGANGQGVGIQITNTGSSSSASNRGNIVRNNKIGVDFSGNAAIPNANAGVLLRIRAADNRIGPDNIISGNGTGTISSPGDSTAYGVALSVETIGDNTGNAIFGNKIGVGANNSPLPNAAGGLKIDRAQGTVVGGANSADSQSEDRGNIIAGNRNSNVFVTVRGTSSSVDLNALIENNFVGMVAASTPASTNAPAGITVERGASAVTVRNNLVSANSTVGVYVFGASGLGTPSNVTIANNRIGTNAGGTAVSNGQQNEGISIAGGASNVTVSGNTVSNNRTYGIKIQSSSNITITSNRIGALDGGSVAIGNGLVGVQILASSGVTVGPSNTISRHTDSSAGAGVSLSSSASNNVIKGNTISDNARGVQIDNSTNNIIGYAGSALGPLGGTDGNTVVNNGRGIQIDGAAARNNRISRTTTSNNVLNGVHAGIQLNSGANASIPAPTITSVTRSGNQLSVNISTGSADCSGVGCTIEIFQNTVSEPNEGKFFLTAFRKTGNGSATLTADLPASGCSPFLTFTTTDQASNTSPFSAVQNVPACNAGEPTGGAQPDLLNPAPPSITVGSALATADVDVSFTATLRNVGDVAGAFALAITAANGLTNPTVSPNPSPSLAPNGEQQITFGARVPRGTAPGTYTLRLTATTQGGGASDSVEVSVVVPLIPGLTFEEANPALQNGGPNQEVCFTHRLTNTGNGTDQFEISVTPPSGWASRVLPTTPITVAAGAAQNVQACVTVPEGATSGDYAFTVVARSLTSPNPTSPTRTNTVRVQDAAVPQLSPVAPINLQADPGGTVVFNRTLTNVGNVAAQFRIDISVPAGWTVTPPTITTSSIARNGTLDFSYSVTVPSGAIAGPYDIGVVATAQQGANAQDAKTDTVSVNRVAALALTPPSQTSAAEPGDVVTYTLSLRNNGNFTDTIRLDVSRVTQAARGWAASVVPPITELAPGESEDIELVVRVPFGQPTSISNDTTVVATSSIPSATAEATATTTIQPVAGARITPIDPIRQALAGETVRVDLTLQNSGSIDQNYSTTFEVVDNPVNATVIFTGTANNTPLAPGETKPLALSVRVPADTPDGTDIVVRIRATSAPGGAVAESLVTIRVGPPYDVIIEPDRTGTGLPGTTVQYSHIVTNTGRLEDVIALSSQSNLGWATTVTPASVRLLPNQSAAVTLTVQIPGSADANAVDTTFVTARSVADPTVSERATVQTTVEQFTDVNLSPSRFAVLRTGTIRFLHTLSNIGNGSDTFTISVAQELDWPVTVVYVEPRDGLGRGGSQLVQIVVTVPIQASRTATNRFYVRAISKRDPTIFSEVVDTIAPVSSLSVGGGDNQLYLPIIGT